ncbi:MAG: DinB family protein [Phycisphaerales bacterium]|nr:DinB family protein [Phycisphaerales bacterium]
MYSPEALLDIHERAHCSLRKLLDHCRSLTPDELNRELPGFGYSSARLQLHHITMAQKYWLSVIEDRMSADENDADYPTIDALEAFRAQTFEKTAAYLTRASSDELNTPRPMLTWRGDRPNLTPAHVILRTQTHIYQHQGQIIAMCKLLGKPTLPGLDFPLA